MAKETNDYSDYQVTQNGIIPYHVVNRVYETGAQYKETYQYFDGFGRNVQTVTGAETGSGYTVTKTYYDAMGRVNKNQGPFFRDNFDYLTEYTGKCYYSSVMEFDGFGRPVIVESPLNMSHTEPAAEKATTRYTYTGFNTVVTDPDDKSTTYRKDYLGRTIEVEPTGKSPTRYEYNAAGDLTAVVDALGNRTDIDYDGLGRKIDLNDPDMGEWTYDYDMNNNLILVTDSKETPQNIEYQYDEMNRIQRKIFPSNPSLNVTYSYDQAELGKGLLYTSTNGAVTTKYEAYDGAGRVKRKTKQIDAYIYTTYYEYLLDGKISNITYPDPANYPSHTGDSYQYSYYPNTDLINEVKGFGYTYAKLSDYTPNGKISLIEFGNGTSNQYFTYDDDTTGSGSWRLIGYSSDKPGGELMQQREYTYSPAGDIKQIVDTKNSITYDYEYDDYHQLKSESQTGGASYGDSYSMQYEYDGSTLHGPSAIKLTRANTTNNYSFAYDGNGNMTQSWDFSNPGSPVSRGVYIDPIIWNPENKPAKIPHATKGATTITYDADGVRAKKVSSGGTIHYAGDHYEYNVTTGTDMQYLFAGNLRIAMVKGGDTYFFHKDHLGSTTTLSTVTGQQQANQTDYFPYGLERNSDGQNVTSYKFTDQEHDSETGLYNYDARLYEPALRIFISPDSIVPDYSNPQSLNRYAYCLNNPIKYVDPTGHKPGYVYLFWGGGLAPYIAKTSNGIYGHAAIEISANRMLSAGRNPEGQLRVYITSKDNELGKRSFDVYRPNFNVNVESLDKKANELVGTSYLKGFFTFFDFNKGNVCSDTTAKAMFASSDDKRIFNWMSNYWSHISPNDIGTDKNFNKLYDFHDRVDW